MKKTLKDIGKVLMSNIISLLSGILVAFLLPKITTVTGYGYYKTFTLYTSYVGLLHFGFCDGVYLKYGGRSFDELNKNRFRLYFFVLTVVEIVVSSIIVSGTYLFVSTEYKFIFYCLALYSLFYIYNSYYQLVSQATSRFTEYSLRTIIYSALRFLSVCALWIIASRSNGVISYKFYIIVLVVLEIALACWYLYTYHSISFGKKDSYSEARKEIVEIFKLGLPLLVSNLVTIFLLALDRQFVSVLFPVETYAVYAFAYSMLSLVTTATSAVATVLFPTLKRFSAEDLKKSYSKLISAILILVYVGMLVYFPLKEFIIWFLPQYTESLVIFRVIFPGIAISSSITIVMYNYYKVLDKTYFFLKINLSILMISAMANLIAFVIFRNTISISAASIVTMVIWYLISERYFIREYEIRGIKNFLFMMIMMFMFYLITSFNNSVVGFILHSLITVFVILVVQNDFVKEVLDLISFRNKAKD